MPIWRDVQYLTIHFGWKVDRSPHKNWLGVEKKNIDEFYLSVPYQDFHAKMKRIVEDVRDQQYEIKAVMPLTEAICMSEISNSRETSWGYGYGTSTIVGYSIIIQKEFEVSQEEYDKRLEVAKVRIALREGNDRKEFLTEQLPRLQKAFDAVKDIQRELVEKKGMLGGTKYRIGGVDYTDKAEAQKIIDKNIATYDKAFNELQAAKDELGKLDELLAVNTKTLEELNGNAEN